LSPLSGDLTARLGFEVSRQMLRRFLKKRGYRWKRFRKSLKSHLHKVFARKRLRHDTHCLQVYGLRITGHKAIQRLVNTTLSRHRRLRARLLPLLAQNTCGQRGVQILLQNLTQLSVAAPAILYT
jgi:hypothetical protein